MDTVATHGASGSLRGIRGNIMKIEKISYQDGERDALINMAITIMTSYKPCKRDVEKYNLARKLLIELRDGLAGNTR